MQKQIKKITTRALKENIAGLKAVDAFHTEYDFEPFLVFTEFYMSQPIFGPHPHAGISVMTYMLPDSKGSFLNRDSRGDKSIIEPGGIHVTQAGIGIYHDETPVTLGVDCHGFQIWINHADKDRLVTPKAFHAFAKDVPEYKSENAFIRVVQGQYERLKSPIELVTKTTILDVTLQPNSSIELDAMEMAFVYLINGELTVTDKLLSNKTFVNFEKDGDKVVLQTKEKSAQFLFLSGTPHHEPIVQGGPFVMTNSKQMQETHQRLQRGEMGILNAI
jgi:hypothetical protein